MAKIKKPSAAAKKLNLGCGQDYKQGFVNLDFNTSFKADVYHDLDVYPYPFADGTFDYVFGNSILEHVTDIVKHLAEVNRICRKGAIVEYWVPFCNSQNNWSDFTHKHSFTQHSMNIVVDNTSNKRQYLKSKFDLMDVTCDRGGLGYLMPKFLADKLCFVLGEVYQTVKFTLRVKK